MKNIDLRLQSQQKHQIYGSFSQIPEPYDQILSCIINLPYQHLSLLKCIFMGRKRFRKVFYSLTTIGNSIGYERSWTGRLAHELRKMGLLKIHGRYMDTHIWELGDALCSSVVYTYLHDYFMGFGVKDLLSKLPVVRKNPLLILTKKISIRKEGTESQIKIENQSTARGSSPRSASPPTRKQNFVQYCDRWDEARWMMEYRLKQEAQTEPNIPMTDAEWAEIFA